MHWSSTHYVIIKVFLWDEQMVWVSDTTLHRRMATLRSVDAFTSDYHQDVFAPLPLSSKDLATRLKSKLNTELFDTVIMARYSPESRMLLDLSREKLIRSVGQLDSLKTQGCDLSLFDCTYCEGFMAQPVCLPCGHSLCKSCILKAGKLCGIVCPKCKEPVAETDTRKPTIMLQNALKCCFPTWVESCSYREMGNVFANEGDFPVAIEWYDKAIKLGITDHRVYGNRSRAYLAISDLDRAFADAKMACMIRPLWKKNGGKRAIVQGHFRRACALESQGNWMDAVAAYLVCLYLSDGNDNAIKAKMCQLLDAHLSFFTNYERLLASSTIHAACASNPVKEPLSTQTIDRIVRISVDSLKATSDVTSSKSICLDANDFECPLCTGLVFQPVTVTCGHSFCRSCLSRAFDHSKTCPVCRSVLYEFFQAYSENSGIVNTDKTLSAVTQQVFPEQYHEKKAQMDAESLRNFRVGTSESEPLPIFVCTQALPGIPCPIHVFEPRYRLMIRRCIQGGGRRFGMCQPAITDSNEHSFSDYGTVLYINSVEYTTDGRSLVKTVGERRFKVISRYMNDGYHRARVEFIFDERVTDQSDIDSLRAFQREVYAHAKQWLDALPIPVKSLMMQSACSPLPPLEDIPEVCPNGPMWMWWYIHTVPLSPQQKQQMYTCMSLRERLRALKEALPVVHLS